MDPYQVIKRVRVTEKGQHLSGQRKYTFVVHPEATKPQIKTAVKTLFARDVAAVNVINVFGKNARRTRFGAGRRSDWKKAIVTLKAGQEPLQLF
jgi:large subunit ribosomal protein L23